VTCWSFCIKNFWQSRCYNHMKWLRRTLVFTWGNGDSWLHSFSSRISFYVRFSQF
jgi:hypothetical protein